MRRLTRKLQLKTKDRDVKKQNRFGIKKCDHTGWYASSFLGRRYEAISRLILLATAVFGLILFVAFGAGCAVEKDGQTTDRQSSPRKGGEGRGQFFTDGPGNIRKIALTFDDGPGASTPELLELLENRGVKASFFMNGNAVRSYPDLAARAAKAGHMICNHTDRHLNYFKLGGEGKELVLEKEIDKAGESIYAATGVRTSVMRMPNGYSREWVRITAGKKGYTLVNWTYGSDWTNISGEEMLTGYLAHVRAGAILLLHDGGSRRRDKTLKITAAIIDEAGKKGLQPVRLDELLGITHRNEVQGSRK